MTTIFSRPCHQCKNKFETEKKSASFCSDHCVSQWLSTRPKATCKFCTGQFLQKSKHHLFCTKLCSEAHAKTNSQKTVQLVKNCKHCANPFTTPYPNKVFCTIKCKRAANNEARPYKLKERPCEFCKKLFQPTNDKHRFDTDECRLKALSNKTCKQCGKDFISSSDKSSFCSTVCVKSWVDAENAQKKAVKPPPRSIELKKTVEALERLLSSIDATGGLFVDQTGMHSLVADEEAFGIAAAYIAACKAIGRPQKIETDPKLLNECRICGCLTSTEYENACGCKSFYCPYCRTKAKSEMCLRHSKEVA